MTRRRWLVLGALAVVAAAIWIAVATTGGGGDDHTPTDRPERLLDLRPSEITSVEAAGHPIPLDQVRGDLAPLLAVRTLTRADSSYGLDPPALVVTVRTKTRTYELRLGAYNFDKTAVYAAIGTKVGTILPRLAERLAAAAGVTIPQETD